MVLAKWTFHILKDCIGNWAEERRLLYDVGTNIIAFTRLIFCCIAWTETNRVCWGGRKRKRINVNYCQENTKSLQVNQSLKMPMCQVNRPLFSIAKTKVRKRWSHSAVLSCRSRKGSEQPLREDLVLRGDGVRCRSWSREES